MQMVLLSHTGNAVHYTEETNKPVIYLVTGRVVAGCRRLTIAEINLFTDGELG